MWSLTLIGSFGSRGRYAANAIKTKPQEELKQKEKAQCLRYGTNWTPFLILSCRMLGDFNLYKSFE